MTIPILALPHQLLSVEDKQHSKPLLPLTHRCQCPLSCSLEVQMTVKLHREYLIKIQGLLPIFSCMSIDVLLRIRHYPQWCLNRTEAARCSSLQKHGFWYVYDAIGCFSNAYGTCFMGVLKHSEKGHHECGHEQARC